MARIYMNPGAAKEVLQRVKVFTSKVIEDEIFNPENPLLENPFEVEEDGYIDMTVLELKQSLKTRGLAMGGNKAELIQRLRLDDAGSETSEEAPADAAADKEEVAPADAAATETPHKEATVSESEENSTEKPVIE